MKNVLPDAIFARRAPLRTKLALSRLNRGCNEGWVGRGPDTASFFAPLEALAHRFGKGSNPPFLRSPRRRSEGARRRGGFEKGGLDAVQERKAVGFKKFGNSENIRVPAHFRNQDNFAEQNPAESSACSRRHFHHPTSNQTRMVWLPSRHRGFPKLESLSSFDNAIAMLIKSSIDGNQQQRPPGAAFAEDFDRFSQGPRSDRRSPSHSIPFDIRRWPPLDTAAPITTDERPLADLWSLQRTLSTDRRAKNEHIPKQD